MKYILVLAFAFLSFSVYADKSPDELSKDYSGNVYQSDNPVCKSEAYLAATFVQGKQGGVTYKNAMRFARALSENNTIALQLVQQIYTAGFAKQLSIEGAYSAYGADCDIANK